MKLLTQHNKTLLLYAVTALVTFALLYAGIFSDYGFTDAYEFLWSADKNPIFKHVFIQTGRPLYGELNQLIYGTLCNTVSDLKWIRLAALIGCILLSTQIFHLLLQLNFKKIEAGLFSLLMLAIPSVGIYVSWSAIYEIPWALNISFYSGVLLLKNKQSIPKYVLALSLNIVALSLYQSAATAFLIPLVFTLITNQTTLFKLALRFGVFFAVSFGVYFLIFKLSLYLYNIPALDRADIEYANLPYRFFNFYLNELKNTFYGSAILLRSYLLLFVGTSLFLGFFILLIKKNKFNKNFLLLLLFLLIVLPITYTPNLISPDTWKSSRTIGVTAIIVLFYQFYLLRSLSQNKAIVKYISLALALVFIIGNSLNVNNYFTSIAVKEHNALKAAFIKVLHTPNKKILLVRPTEEYLQNAGFYKRKYVDEFGQLSSERDWVPVPLFHQIMLEQHQNNYTLLNVVSVTQEEFIGDTDSTVVINLEEVIKKTFSKTN